MRAMTEKSMTDPTRRHTKLEVERAHERNERNERKIIREGVPTKKRSSASGPTNKRSPLAKIIALRNELET